MIGRFHGRFDGRLRGWLSAAATPAAGLTAFAGVGLEVGFGGLHSVRAALVFVAYSAALSLLVFWFGHGIFRRYRSILIDVI